MFLSAVCLLIIVVNIINPKFTFLKSYFPMQYLHKDVVGVLVIGESARYSNFAINGYERNTTPNLSKVDNLASFKAHACANTTYLSVPCMLSRYGEKDFNLIDTETSMLSILNRLGFDTVWMGTQSITKYYKNKPGGSFCDEVNFHMIPGGSLVFLTNRHDGQMLPHLEKNLESNSK